MKPADRVATSILRTCGVSLSPPIDIESLAHNLGVAQIQPREMFEDGRLERRGNSTKIFVRENLNRGRTRFTIAHEIAHLLLAEPQHGPITAFRDRLRTDDEERLCDEIAASLLLPAAWVRNRFLGRLENLSTVRHLSHLADVSLSAATVRLNELCGWNSSLLHWRKSGGRWVFVAGAAIPPSLHGEIRSAPGTSSVLDSVGSRTRRDTRERIPLAIAGRCVHVDARLSVSSSNALALVSLNRREGRYARPRGS